MSVKLFVIVIIVFKRYPSTYCLMQRSYLKRLLKFEHFTSIRITTFKLTIRTVAWRW